MIGFAFAFLKIIIKEHLPHCYGIRVRPINQKFMWKNGLIIQANMV